MTHSSSSAATTSRSVQVFRAWADPALKARSLAGSADALGAGYELDFRVGGTETNRGGPPSGPVCIRTSRSSATSFPNSELSTRTKCTPMTPPSRCLSPPCNSTDTRCNDTTGPHGARGLPRRSRHRGPEGRGDPVPSGLPGCNPARSCIVMEHVLMSLSIAVGR